MINGFNLCRPDRQNESERRTVARLARNQTDFSPNRMARALLIVKPRPVPPNLQGGRGVGLVERLEQAGDLFLGQADARVDDVDLQTPAAVSASIRETDRTPPCSVNLMALPTRLTRICRSRVGSV